MAVKVLENDRKSIEQAISDIKEIETIEGIDELFAFLKERKQQIKNDRINAIMKRVYINCKFTYYNRQNEVCKATAHRINRDYVSCVDESGHTIGVFFNKIIDVE